MATTVLRNGIDRFKWQRPFTKGKFASSTAHSNCIPHEFSVVLASCLCIKLRAVPAHVFFVNTIGVTHFNTLVRFVSVSLRPLLSHQSANYLTRKTVTTSRQEEKIFLNVIWKKRIYPFRENVLHTCVIRCSVLFLVIFTKKKMI